MDVEKFFTLPDGRDAELIKLRLPDGSGVDLTNFGGCLTALYVPDVCGILTDVLPGWKNPVDYLVNPGYLGALVGRIPNRISGGRFTLDGKIYQMCLNDNNICTLHGGFGFSHRLWKIEKLDDTQVTLSLFSPDGDSGFPGDLNVCVSYRWLPGHTLEIEFFAESDRLTVADFTSHAYFNLDGENTGSTADHTVVINAGAVTETDRFLQMTGKLIPVENTRFDLRHGKRFSEILSENPNGFDDNFILSSKEEACREVAWVTAGRSGIKLTVATTRPGLQFYMGGFLNCEGKSRYLPHSGFCLETQSWPDSVNHDHFPDVTVAPGKPHRSITRYSFSCEN